MISIIDLNRESKKPDWTEDIKEDVIEECSKHGGCIHVHVDQQSRDGNVYIKCPTIAVAMSVTAALNGRYFGGQYFTNYIIASKYGYLPINSINCLFEGRIIQTTFIPVANYSQLFPESFSAQNILTARK